MQTYIYGNRDISAAALYSGSYPSLPWFITAYDLEYCIPETSHRLYTYYYSTVYYIVAQTAIWNSDIHARASLSTHTSWHRNSIYISSLVVSCKSVIVACVCKEEKLLQLVRCLWQLDPLKRRLSVAFLGKHYIKWHWEVRLCNGQNRVVEMKCSFLCIVKSCIYAFSHKRFRLRILDLAHTQHCNSLCLLGLGHDYQFYMLFVSKLKHYQNKPFPLRCNREGGAKVGTN